MVRLLQPLRLLFSAVASVSAGRLNTIPFAEPPLRGNVPQMHGTRSGNTMMPADTANIRHGRRGQHQGLTQVPRRAGADGGFHPEGGNKLSQVFRSNGISQAAPAVQPWSRVPNPSPELSSAGKGYPARSHAYHTPKGISTSVGNKAESAKGSGALMSTTGGRGASSKFFSQGGKPSLIPRAASLAAASDFAERPHVAVVGAGWGGWGAAKALVENGCRVTLLDGMPDPTGHTPYLTPTGKPFEAGTRGFWFDYPNINALVTKYLGLREDEVFTDFTNSSFYSPSGLEATAPVFSKSALPELPSPFGQVAATFALFERIPIADRATMGGLLLAMLDYTRDEETFEAYDRMTAQQLFVQMGISKRLVEDFIKPTLLVGLFKPPEELSAAVAMELLYFYALAHQTSFDVRWIKSRSISELIIAPLADALAKETELIQDSDDGGAGDDAKAERPLLSVLGGSFVESIELDEGDRHVHSLTYADRKSGEKVTLSNLSGVVLALGAKGMKAVLRGSAGLAKNAPELAQASSLESIDVIAVRLWLDKTVPTRTPANVFSRFDALRGAGGTFFMLDQLQDADPSLLWGTDNVQGSVVACDFYNAGALLPLSDAEIVRTLMEDLLPNAVPEFSQATVVDSYVQRFPGAVSWFSPGSYRKRPPLQTSIGNLVCAGDWVRLGDRETGAKGLCQERAYISGLEAANLLARSGTLGLQHRRQHEVLPIREDEPQVKAGRRLNELVADVLKPIGLTPNPFLPPGA